jgi:predicted enzyme related to lactoylglutathione lyase
MPRVAHFEIHADEPERAARFYTDVFGWQITSWEGPAEYWLVTTGPDSEPGINGGIVKRQGVIDGTAVIAYVCTVDVPDIDATERAVLASGGEQVLDRMAVPGVGWLSYFKDTEGNIFGAMQPDESAG